MYNTFTHHDVFFIVLSFLTAGFSAIGYRNTKNNGWLFLIATSFSPVFRGGYNFIENAIMINSFPKPQPFFTYWDYFSKAIFIIGIASLALVNTPIEEKDACQKSDIGFGQTVTLGWILPSTLLLLSMVITLALILRNFYLSAIIQTIGIALPILYITLCLVLARIYSAKRDLIGYGLRLHFKMFIAGVLAGILRRYI